MLNAPSALSRHMIPPDRLLKTAQAFEASFVKEMLAATDLGKIGDGSQDEFRSFLLDAYAERIVQKGGFGLAEAVMHAMRKTPE